MAYLTTVGRRCFSLALTDILSLSDMDSFDKLNDLFASDDGCTLQRFLSEIGANDVNFDMNDLLKLDSGKGFDCRTLSEFVSLTQSSR